MTFRKDVRSTYLSKKIHSDIKSPSKHFNMITIDTLLEIHEGPKNASNKVMKPIIQPHSDNRVPIKHPQLITVPKTTAMASIAGKNEPKSSKSVDWKIVSHRGTKNKNARDTRPGQVKNAEESKCRKLFTRKVENTGRLISTAQNILHAANLILMVMKASALLRLKRLRFNDRGSLMGLTSSETTAETMITRFKKYIYIKQR